MDNTHCNDGIIHCHGGGGRKDFLATSLINSLVHTSMHTHMKTQTHDCAHTHTHTSTCTYAHTHMYTYTCIYAHTGIHIYTHATAKKLLTNLSITPFVVEHLTSITGWETVH